MNSQPPILRPISWSAILCQAVIFGLFTGAGYWLYRRDGFVLAGCIYLAYSFCSRFILTRDHRAGISLVKRQQFEAAIPCFQRSLEFLDRHSWIDDYRSVAMMSAAAMSYREMALANIAFCYSQIGEGAKSRHYYEKCLERSPQNGVATAALRMMDSAVNECVQRP